MTRKGWIALALVACVVGGVLAVPLLLFLVMLDGAQDSADVACGIDGDVILAADSGNAALSETQLRNAATVVAAGNALDVPREGIVIALAVALQESRLLNYANDGLGGDLSVAQLGIAASLDLPHEAVGTDHGSVGIFQQQWPWWGTLEELMDPATSATLFYEALLQVPGWQRMPLTDAAQWVQRSAYPNAYADDQALAERLLSDPALASAAVRASYDVDCVGVTYPGTVVFPLPTGASYVDQRSFGRSGAHWARGHTGTDLSVACGTPVLAATNGTVVIRRDQPWAGPWLVQVTTGPGALTTWYAHMQSVSVTDGEQVEAGQPLGEVGSLGNSTGCHLHFEVHPRGGAIYEDAVDPTAWLARNVGRDLGGTISPVSASDGEFILATFNVLGHSHTRPGGNKPGWASSSTRMRWAVDLLEEHRVDVVGLQEFQRPQERDFVRLAGSRYDTYAAPHDPQNTIAWRRARFALVSGRTFEVPYFGGREKDMPVVRLRDRVSGVEFIVINVHNPASTRWNPGNERHRDEAMRRQAALVESLTGSTNLPVFLVGDFNERAEAFCRLTASGTLHASAGGVPGPDCRAPEAGIDWIFGTRDVTFSDHTMLRGGLVARTTDHPLVLAKVG